jgi:O-antigen ligase
MGRRADSLVPWARVSRVLFHQPDIIKVGCETRENSMDRDRSDAVLERVVLSLTLAALVYAPLALGAGRTLDLLVLECLAASAAGVWVVRIWIQGDSRLVWPPVCWTALIFVAYAIVRCNSAEIPFLARISLDRLLVYAVFFVVIANNLKRSESSTTVVVVLALVGMALSFYAVYQFATKSDRIWWYTRHSEFLNRGSGTFTVPNTLAGFLAMTLSVVSASLIVGRGSYAAKILLGYAIVAMLAGLGVTLSRGGWMAFGASAIFLFLIFLAMRDYRISAVIGLVTLGILGVLLASQIDFDTRRFGSLSPDGRPSEARFEYWKAAIRMWEEQPLCGVGPGHFAQRFRSYRPEHVQVRPAHAHNDYLNTLAEWGAVGLSIILVFTGMLGVLAWRTWREVQPREGVFNPRGSNRAALVLGSMAALVAAMVHSTVDFDMQVPATALLAITLMAFLVGQSRHASSEGGNVRNPMSLSLRLVVSTIALIAILYLGCDASRRASEFGALRAAASAASTSQERLQHLERAHRIEPTNPETPFHIAEIYRARSQKFGKDFYDSAQDAFKWYQVAQRLNPWEPAYFIFHGVCLDSIGLHDWAGPIFDRAGALDPHGEEVFAFLGWHQLHLQEWAKAREFFERSLRWNYGANQLSRAGLEMANRKLRGE